LSRSLSYAHTLPVCASDLSKRVALHRVDLPPLRGPRRARDGPRGRGGVPRARVVAREPRTLLHVRADRDGHGNHARASSPRLPRGTADAAQIYRLWVVWGHSRAVVVLPTLLMLFDVAGFGVILYGDARNLAVPGLDIYVWSAVIFICEALTNLLCAGAYRAFFVRTPGLTRRSPDRVAHPARDADRGPPARARPAARAAHRRRVRGDLCVRRARSRRAPEADVVRGSTLTLLLVGGIFSKQAAMVLVLLDIIPAVAVRTLHSRTS
jgi:hypothetical protein